LVIAAIEAWDSLEDHIFKNLCGIMPNRIVTVIAAEGWYKILMLF
jgi:hypothetical protein